jgi:2-keto-4-pentenoate hydratase/2-oxohepta-3-ene-1,7-dioic acid hydratase in catechol pathway
MRLCRFMLEDELPLTGFHLGDSVVPLDQALEVFSESEGRDLYLGETDDLVPLLDADSESGQAVAELAKWVEKLGPEDLETLAIGLDSLSLLNPLPRPGKILMLARNYPEHSVEQGDIAAERSQTFPYLFLKPPSALTDPGAPIVIPRISPGQIDWECELGVVIGSTCRHVAEEDALQHVAGYTVVNDISDRGFKPNPGRKPRERDAFFDWQHGKWHDSSCPVGPCIASAASIGDPQRLRITLSVNGAMKQDSSTGQMIFPVAAIIAFASSLMTLEPGDLISTGTPAGVGKARGEFLKPGDLVAAEIEGIGRLENPVEAE